MLADAATAEGATTARRLHNRYGNVAAGDLPRG